jgi:2-succinyl-5-enolpyruvyl-6-hydroxy-3-cyclohexene-1-carboxylate synthase
VTNELLGPVHLNIQFRENLAPDAGPIRGDNRAGSITSFSSNRFTDIANFQRWSTNGKKWSQSYSSTGSNNDLAMYEVANAIVRSKRGIIVVGNLRSNGIVGGSSDSASIAAIISDFAESIGFPVFAGAQTASLRFYSPAVIPYAG